eukprot:3174075-Amphidinium_carterae.3
MTRGRGGSVFSETSMSLMIPLVVENHIKLLQRDAMYMKSWRARDRIQSRLAAVPTNTQDYCRLASCWEATEQPEMEPPTTAGLPVVIHSHAWYNGHESASDLCHHANCHCVN